MIMNNKDIFYLHFQDKFFENEEIITSIDNNTYQVRVLEKPTKRWYSLLIQYLTFGLFKATWKYKVKLIENE